VGRNKEIRKKVEGHRRMVLDHQVKVRQELKKPDPDYGLIANWEKRIHIVEMEIIRLESKLRRH
jgi:hypothetical protein